MSEGNLSDKIVFGGLALDKVKENDDHAVIRRRDVKEFIQKVKKSIDTCADKTDIWDNERWGKFRKIFISEINSLGGKKLV